MKTWWLRLRGGRYTDKQFLEACAEVFALRKQVQRLKDAMERDIREHIAERREWFKKENQLVDLNHQIATQLVEAHARLALYEEVSG